MEHNNVMTMLVPHAQNSNGNNTIPNSNGNNIIPNLQQP
jgi:hypothetical protein